MSADVLITGGAGYIGSALIRELRRADYNIRIIDNFANSTPRNLMASLPVEFIRGDIRDRKTVKRALDGISTVIHLAAITGAGNSHDIEDQVMDVNCNGTRTLLELAEMTGVEKLVFASSCNVYGETYKENITEETPPAPRNPYAESKLTAEEMCKTSDIETVCLRLATNFGWSPGIRFNLVVNAFVFRALVDEPLTIYGDGTNWRPFIHVQDSTRVFRQAIHWQPGIYNVGHENFRIREIATAVKETVDRSVETDYLEEEDPGPSYHADFTKARQTGFETEYSLKQGIEDLVTRLKISQKQPQ